MKTFVFLLFIAGLAAVALAAEDGERESCPLACGRNYKPYCAQYLDNGVWKSKWFSNVCEYRDYNVCDGGHYVPCLPESEVTKSRSYPSNDERVYIV